MFSSMIRADDGQKFEIYRDIFSVYKKVLLNLMADRDLPEGIVSVKGGKEMNPNRAPHIVLHRPDLVHNPRSLLLNETREASLMTGADSYMTKHVLDYPIGFTVSGNSYLEAEKLGTIALDAILLAGMTPVKLLHPNIIGADLVSWSSSEPVKGPDSNYYESIVVGKVFLMMDGTYTTP